MEESNLNIDLDELNKDIEALKNATTDEEIDSIMAKYEKYFNEDNNESFEESTLDSDSSQDSNEEQEKEKSIPNTPIKKTASTKAKPKSTSKTTTKAEPKGRTYNGKYEIYQVGGDYQYHLKASNGEILFVSETYTSRDGVLKAIDALKRNLETGELRIFKDKKGNYKFKLVSKNYRVLAISSTYSQEKGAVRASESFIKFASKADNVFIDYEDVDLKTATIIKIEKNEDKQGGKFEIELFDGEYSWDLKASNGQILCQAEGFTSKKGCMNSIDSFKKNIEEGTFKSVKDKNGNYCFKLYTPAGRVCAIGESYTSKTSAESAANSVASFYKNAEVEFIEI